MYYYAYINSSNICEGTYGFPSQINEASYIYLGTTDDQSVIGKRWNATTQQWEEVTNFYYAQLNEKDICIGVTEYPSAVTSDSLIRIPSLDETLIGMWYDRTDETFKTAPFRILADHSTDVVNYRSTDLCLSDVLDAKAAATDVYTKTEVDAAIAAAGGTGSAGEDGEDGLSAYQIAVNNGFEGTETQWLASLQGEDGTDGVDGADGTTVVVGTTTTGDAGTSAAVVGVQNGNTLTLNFTIPKGADGQDGTGADVTANNILDKLKTVDGQNSGLDADLLDGHNADYFATATQLAGKADTDHTHTDYAASNHTHSGYAAASHTHSNYASTSHSHTLSELGAAASSHTHSGYASSSHTHSNYFEKTGGTISGETNFSGGLVRVGGQQCIYNSGSMVTLSTNNLETMIAGSKIYSKVTISTSSDERLKENIVAADSDKMVELIENIKVVNFNYKEDKTKAVVVGVVAQQLIEAQPDIAKYLVEMGEDGYYSVKIADLVFPLIAAVQKLSAEVKALKEK